MAGSALPPSRFGAGYTEGTPAAPVASAPLRARPAPIRVNRLAVVSFVAALVLGLIVAPITLPLALAAQRQIRRSGEAGARLAAAAVIISGLYLVVCVVVAGLYFYLG